MAILFGSGKKLFTDDGIPYMWQSGDVTTTPSASDVMSYSSGAVGDQFGESVAVGSGRIVVGDAYKDFGSNGDQGLAHIFDLNGNVTTLWIAASDGAAGDGFGNSVAVGSGRIVVGARLDDVGINTNQGSAYIYDLDGNNEVKITASDGAAYDYFGKSVAVGHQKIVVGADQKNGAGIIRGAAYIYDLDGTQVGILTGDDSNFDKFGSSVAVGSGRIVVGATGAGSDPSNRGAAYIYDLDGNNEIKITASDGDTYDEFGISVAVGSGRIVVGADSVDVGINTSQGAAYIFDLDGNQLSKITASDGAAYDYFGASVAVGSGRIVVGARGVDIGSNTFQGAAYVYDLDGNLIKKITDPNGNASDQFGESVAVGSGRIVIGSPGDGIGGTAHLYDTPLVYNLYDAIDLNYK